MQAYGNVTTCTVLTAPWARSILAELSTFYPSHDCLRIRGKTVTNILCWTVYYNSAQWYGHTRAVLIQLTVISGLRLVFVCSFCHFTLVWFLVH